MRIRQLALVARELSPVVDDLCAVLGVRVCFRDPGVGEFGLHNALMPLGDQFLEVVSPIREDTTAGRFLERRGGDGGYMVILQTSDLAKHRKRLSEIGVRVVWEIAFPDIATIHLHPSDVGGAIVSLDEARPAASWRWAGPDWRDHVTTDRVGGIAGAELAARDPGAMAARWAAALDRPAAEAGGGAHEIALDGGVLRFVPESDGRGDRLAVIDVRASDPTAVVSVARERGLPADVDGVVLGGTRFRLVP